MYKFHNKIIIVIQAHLSRHFMRKKKQLLALVGFKPQPSDSHIVASALLYLREIVAL